MTDKEIEMKNRLVVVVFAIVVMCCVSMDCHANEDECDVMYEQEIEKFTLEFETIKNKAETFFAILSKYYCCKSNNGICDDLSNQVDDKSEDDV